MSRECPKMGAGTSGHSNNRTDFQVMESNSKRERTWGAVQEHNQLDSNHFTRSFIYFLAIGCVSRNGGLDKCSSYATLGT